MGYVLHSTKLWRIWDCQSRRIFVASSVRFDEASVIHRANREASGSMDDPRHEAIEQNISEPSSINSTSSQMPGDPSNESSTQNTHPNDWETSLLNRGTPQTINSILMPQNTPGIDNQGFYSFPDLCQSNRKCTGVRFSLELPKSIGRVFRQRPTIPGPP